MRDLYVGIDLGGSKILAAVVTAGGTILSRASRTTPIAGAARALSGALIEAASAALEVARTPRERIAAVGLGAPGPIDPERGLILRTPHIRVRRFPAREVLAAHFRVPVAFDNDVDMALYGEWRAGAAIGRKNVIALWIGTGVGGAVLWNGELVSGSNGNAGEIGHMLLDGRKARARSDEGSLEWEASKSGIVRWIRGEKKKGRRTSLGDEFLGRRRRAHSDALRRAVRAGDRLAIEAAVRSSRYVGIAVANLFSALAPDLFVLGGGVVEALGRPYVERVRRFANQFAFTTELGRVEIARSRLGDDAGVIGAALRAAAEHPPGGRRRRRTEQSTDSVTGGGCAGPMTPAQSRLGW